MAEETNKKSPLLEKEVKNPPMMVYTDEQKTYLSNLQIRLKRSRDIRDGIHDEFDGMNYTRHCEENRKLMNSYVQPKVNKEDSNYHSGTVREKAMAILAQV